jgi:hypothetical protein
MLSMQIFAVRMNHVTIYGDHCSNTHDPGFLTPVFRGNWQCQDTTSMPKESREQKRRRERMQNLRRQREPTAPEAEGADQAAGAHK